MGKIWVKNECKKFVFVVCPIDPVGCWRKHVFVVIEQVRPLKYQSIVNVYACGKVAEILRCTAWTTGRPSGKDKE